MCDSEQFAKKTPNILSGFRKIDFKDDVIYKSLAKSGISAYHYCHGQGYQG